MRPPKTTDDPLQVPVTIGTRVHFAWAVFWVCVLTAVFALGYLLTHIVRPTTGHFTWWARHWGRAMMRMMGIRVRAEGLAHLDGTAPCVLVANHQNGLDIPVVADCLPVPFGFVAKAELERVPFLGAALRYSPSVFVTRSDPRRSLESMRRAAARIRAGSSVLVFPEGARSYDGQMSAFQKGAFQLAVESGVPIVPVTILDGPAVFNEKRRVSRPGVIHVVVHAPIPLEGLTRRDVPELMERVYAIVTAPLPPAWRIPRTEAP